VDLVNARPAKDHKKGADTGIDGYINFFDDKSDTAKQVIVQVKSGYIHVNHVRDLKGVLDREKAAIGGLVTLREPTKQMLLEAASAGFYESKDFPGRCLRLQILTIAELLGERSSITLPTPTERFPEPSATQKLSRKICFSVRPGKHHGGGRLGYLEEVCDHGSSIPVGHCTICRLGCRRLAPGSPLQMLSRRLRRMPKPRDPLLQPLASRKHRRGDSDVCLQRAQPPTSCARI
jgi:hypothetical protein